MNKLIIMGVVLFLSGSGWSQETVTLEAAKAYALEHNWNVKNAMLDVKIAEQKVIETRGMVLTSSVFKLRVTMPTFRFRPQI